MRELAPGIVVFDDIFLNSIDYIKEIENSGIQWHPAEVLVEEKDNKSGTNTKARDTDIIMLPHHTTEQSGMLEDFAKRFHDEMKVCLSLVNCY
jgi:hypothetical protein